MYTNEKDTKKNLAVANNVAGRVDAQAESTGLEDNRPGITISPPVFSPMQLTADAPVLQRAIWQYGEAGWAKLSGEGEAQPEVEAAPGQVYDDVRLILYAGTAEQQTTEAIITGISGAGRSGNLSVLTTDVKGKAHGGFKEKMVSSIIKLVSKPAGRKLILGLAAGGKSVAIRPSDSYDPEAAATPTWSAEGDAAGPSGEWEDEGVTAGATTDVTVLLPASMDDDTLKSYNSDYELIDNPMFVTLGHELIHAQHMTTGTAYGHESVPEEDPEYHNKEEEKTIATGDISENVIRAEHDLPARFGHEGVDTSDTGILLESLGTRQIGEIANLLGVPMNSIIEANPDRANGLVLAEEKIIREYLEHNPRIIKEMKHVFYALKWREIFKANTKELETLLINHPEHQFKGVGDMENKKLDDLLQLDPDAGGKILTALEDARIDHHTIDFDGNTLGELMTQDPRLRPIFQKNVQFIKPAEVDQKIQDVATIEVGDMLMIDDKYLLTDLVISFNPKFASQLLHQQLGIGVFEKIPGGDSPENCVKMVEQYSGLAGLTLPSKVLIPGCFMHRITKAQAVGGKATCLARLGELFTVDPAELDSGNPASGFGAGQKIVVCSSWADFR